MTKRQLLLKGIAEHLVDRGDEYKRDAFSELENARDRLPEEVYIDLRVEHDTLSFQRDELMDAVAKPTADLVVKSNSYKGAARAFSTAVHDATSRTSMTPVESRSSSHQNKDDCDQAEGHEFHPQRSVSTQKEHSPGYDRLRIDEEKEDDTEWVTVDSGRPPLEAHVTHEEHIREQRLPPGPNRDGMRPRSPELSSWLRYNLASLDSSLNVATLEEKLWTLPTEDVDEGCRQCIVDLLNDHGHPDAQDFIEEFLDQRAACSRPTPQVLLPNRQDRTGTTAPQYTYHRHSVAGVAQI